MLEAIGYTHHNISYPYLTTSMLFTSKKLSKDGHSKGDAEPLGHHLQGLAVPKSAIWGVYPWLGESRFGRSELPHDVEFCVIIGVIIWVMIG